MRLLNRTKVAPNDLSDVGVATVRLSDNIVITMQAIPVTIRSIGNSKGVVLPKPVLAQVGLEDAVGAQLTVENGAIVLRRAAPRAREGWAEAAKRIAAQGDDHLVMGEFGNDGDAEHVW